MNSAPEALNPIAGFEPLLQAPARLQVMAVLAQVQEAEFARLKELTASSDSVMSKHLSALSEAGFIALRKAALDGRQRTWASLTRAGRRTFDDHVAALQRIVAGV
ncbi:MAG: transcriptional regulator [Sphingomonas sp.]|uniref:transcriptional regulator n=1 Tax=Sphingomonas sp. TaxID=28214 RepID=UPI003F7DAAD5